jgi:hypothetical protein
MKKIVKRHLPLDVKYTCIDKKYISILDGSGCSCDNCGKLIANIATVKSVNGVYNIGFDCLETFLLNNNLLEGFDLIEYEKVKKWIPQVIRVSKKIKDTMESNPKINITGLSFESPVGDFYPFYWLKNNETKSRDNDYIKIKGMDYLFMVNTIKCIFPRLNIIVNE